MQQMAELAGKWMEEHKVKFIKKHIPTKVSRYHHRTTGTLYMYMCTTSRTSCIFDTTTCHLSYIVDV